MIAIRAVVEEIFTFGMRSTVPLMIGPNQQMKRYALLDLQQTISELLPPRRDDLPEDEDVSIDNVSTKPSQLENFGMNERSRAPEEDTYDNPGGEPNVQCAQQ